MEQGSVQDLKLEIMAQPKTNHVLTDKLLWEVQAEKQQRGVIQILQDLAWWEDKWR